MHILSQLFVAYGAAGDESLVNQALGHDDVHEGVEQRHVRVGLELQMPVRQAGEVRAARVQHQQLAAIFNGVLDPGGSHWMIDRRVGANDDNHLGFADIHDGVGHGARAYALKQGDHR